jgi:acyl-[acyl carrier protein]--UDP-N-acetylglucosamine O-acyltransferase
MVVLSFVVFRFWRYSSIVPFGFAKGQIAVLARLNVVGLRRRGVNQRPLHDGDRRTRLIWSISIALLFLY